MRIFSFPKPLDLFGEDRLHSYFFTGSRDVLTRHRKGSTMLAHYMSRWMLECHGQLRRSFSCSYLRCCTCSCVCCALAMCMCLTECVTIFVVVRLWISCHVADYKPIYVVVNSAIFLICIIAKIPEMHRVRLFGINSTLGMDVPVNVAKRGSSGKEKAK